MVKSNAKIVTKEYIRNFFCLGNDESSDAELETIYARLERISFENGENICVIDDDPDGMYFLESGTVVVLNREEEQVNLMYEGQYFGEYAVLSHTKRLSTVQAAGRCTVYKLSEWDMQDILAQHPGIYGEFMKRVYAQLTKKHTKILEVTRMRRRNIADKRNQKPMPLGQMCLCYGITTAIIVLLGVFSACFPKVPMFFAPLILMLGYALITRRIVEAMLVGSLSASVILYRGAFLTGFADDLFTTVGNPDSVGTAIDMSLMGCVVALTLASGSVTSFRKHMQKRVKTRRGAKLATLGIMMTSAIDEDLCTYCAAESAFETVDEQKIPHEEMALIYGLAPTVLCSFVPFSMWGIWVMGTFNPIADGNSFMLYVRSIPYNFFSILTLLALILFCFGGLPLTKQLKEARKRVKEGGNLWPKGSEAYLNQDRTATWGHAYNLILPILVMIIATCLVRTISGGTFEADTNVGLMVTLIFMFFLYCGQRIISPDNFIRKATDGFRRAT
ncbi:MAG: cyclic nucleotide-binding domain-containing protein [Acetatifactor sp.]|nr:cyclic nucleotide-binding domain-containing protein [Acetatifactor sp.]